MDGEGWVEKEG
jgi:hypothetical protein